MGPADTLLLVVGSRSGAYAGVLFFFVFCALLGIGVAGILRQRGVQRRSSFGVGLALAIAVMVLIYQSSIAGFYEARLTPTGLELHDLLPLVSQRVEWPAVQRVEARPAYRGRWIVRIDVAPERTFESAKSDRETVMRVMEALRARAPAYKTGRP